MSSACLGRESVSEWVIVSDSGLAIVSTELASLFSLSVNQWVKVSNFGDSYRINRACELVTGQLTLARRLYLARHYDKSRSI